MVLPAEGGLDGVENVLAVSLEREQAVVLPPLAGLAGLVLILAALIVVETTRYAQVRRSLRGA
jgi:hypothetical protein